MSEADDEACDDAADEACDDAADEACDDAADERVASRRFIVLEEPSPITCGMRCSSGCPLSLRERIAGLVGLTYSDYGRENTSPFVGHPFAVSFRRNLESFPV